MARRLKLDLQRANGTLKKLKQVDTSAMSDAELAHHTAKLERVKAAQRRVHATVKHSAIKAKLEKAQNAADLLYRKIAALEKAKDKNPKKSAPLKKRIAALQEQHDKIEGKADVLNSALERAASGLKEARANVLQSISKLHKMAVKAAADHD